MHKNLLLIAVLWASTVCCCNIAHAQDIDRSGKQGSDVGISAIDVSVHAGVEEQMHQPESSQKAVNQQESFSSWSAVRQEQPSITSVLHSNVGTLGATPAFESRLSSHSADQLTVPKVGYAAHTSTGIGDTVGRKDLFIASSIQSAGNSSSTLPAFKPLPIPPLPQTETLKLFTGFPQNQFSQGNDYYSLKAVPLLRENTAIHTRQHKINPRTSVRRHNIPATQNSAETSR
jgi:hypothetical protein